MTRWRGAVIMAALAYASPAVGCELRLAEHRGGRVLLSLPLESRALHFEVAFEHSVLGTPVSDRYEARYDGAVWRNHLLEESFQGEGYGLPYAAGPGERLQRDGAGWRLQLDRLVEPLVLRPLVTQRMRVRAGGKERLLFELTDRAVELRVLGCPITPPRS